MIEETLDAGRRRWQFDLSPGDVWAIRGYARERCLHGVRCHRVCAPCHAGCRACRISLNMRCGEYSQEEAQRVIGEWSKYTEAEAAGLVEDVDEVDEGEYEGAAADHMAATDHRAGDGQLVDEADGYRLHLSSNHRSGYLHVYRQRSRFRVHVGKLSLGCYATPVQAAVAYARYVEEEQRGKADGAQSTAASSSGDARAVRAKASKRRHVTAPETSRAQKSCRTADTSERAQPRPTSACGPRTLRP